MGKGETEPPQNLFEQNVTRSFGNGAKTQLFNWRRKRRTSGAREGSWGKWRIWGNKKRGEKSNWWKGPRGRSGGLKKTREKILITFQSSQTRSALIGALISCERENGYIDFSSHHSPPPPLLSALPGMRECKCPCWTLSLFSIISSPPSVSHTLRVRCPSAHPLLLPTCL